MNIDNNLNGLNSINYKRNSETEPNKDFKKELVENLYKKARQEVPQDGNNINEFDPVSVKYTDPRTEDIYYVSVQAGYDKEAPELKVLRASYQLSKDEPVYYMNIIRGSKQDILDYLGNENNLGKIKGCLSVLKERALQGD